ncbi:hypothetical protein [Cupriavidus basilensis]|uniref:hypothetical protein n=1 Tax=Cupriavidus basilensis TaxID=68895 RepID=UPI0039F6CBCB
MKRLILTGAGLMAFSCALSAIAGPDFYAIEKAREAKRAKQRAASPPQPDRPQPVATSVSPRGVVYKRGG